MGGACRQKIKIAPPLETTLKAQDIMMSYIVLMYIMSV